MEFPVTDEELAGIRADANQQLFKDAGRIERITSLGTLNKATAHFEGEVRELIYEGPCSLYPIMSRRDRFDEFGQGLIFTRQYRLVLPWTVDDAQIRDRFIATKSDDPQMIGRELEVRDVVVSTILGYRRLTLHDSRE